MYKCLDCEQEFISPAPDFEALLLSDLKACLICHSQKIIVGLECSCCKQFTNIEDLQQVFQFGTRRLMCKACITSKQ